MAELVDEHEDAEHENKSQDTRQQGSSEVRNDHCTLASRTGGVLDRPAFDYTDVIEITDLVRPLTLELIHRPVNELRDGGEPQTAIQERGNGHLVRGVQNDRQSGITGKRSKRQIQTRKTGGVGCLEIEPAATRQIERGERRGPAVGI